MRSLRLAIAVLAACALAATLALLAFAAPSASRQHAGAAVYCPDKTSRQHDLAQANEDVKRAAAAVAAKQKALATAKRKHAGVAAAQKALRAAQARLVGAKQAQAGAKAALAECG
jgi:hypothetical protein